MRIKRTPLLTGGRGHGRLDPSSTIRIFSTVPTLLSNERSISADIAASFNRLQLETGGTHLCQFFMRVSHGGGKVSVIDLSSERSLFGWYA